MNDDIRSIGIIGSGNIGTAVARLAVAAGLETSIANSRGSESLGELVTELGERAHAVAVPQAAEHSLVVLAVPLTAVQTLPPDLLDGRGTAFHVVELPETIVREDGVTVEYRSWGGRRSPPATPLSPGGSGTSSKAENWS